MDERMLAQLPALGTWLGMSTLALVLAVLVHEVAHAVVGYASGLRVARVMLGPLDIRDHGHPRVRFVPSFQAGVVLVPWDRGVELGALRWSLIGSTAAGPLAGVAFGAVALWLAGGIHLRGPMSLLEMTGQVSLVLGVLNLVPLRTGEALADGRRMFALLLRTRESSHILTATMMVGEALSGRRPREWDAGLLELMERSPDEAFARLCLYEAAMDRGEFELAGRHLDAAIALRRDERSAADAIVFNEAAYYTARHRGDARAARAWLSMADGWTVQPYMRARAEAAVLGAEGRALEGRQRAVAGLAALDRSRRTDDDLCRDQLEELARGAGAIARPVLTRAGTGLTIQARR